MTGYLEVLPPDHPAKFEFVNGIVGNAIPPNFVPACEKGFREAINAGALIGHPVEVSVGGRGRWKNGIRVGAGEGWEQSGGGLAGWLRGGGRVGGWRLGAVQPAVHTAAAAAAVTAACCCLSTSASVLRL